MPLKAQQDESPAVNLTPMIDVLFLLIIFFMVATHFGDLERNIDVAVPQVAETGPSTPLNQPLVINIFADGHVELDGEPLSLEELTDRLAARRSQMGDPSVVIRGDAHCEFQDVAAALAACRQANVSELGISVRLAGAAGAVAGPR